MSDEGECLSEEFLVEIVVRSSSGPKTFTRGSENLKRWAGQIPSKKSKESPDGVWPP